jgi:hypothetical protein
VHSGAFGLPQEKSHQEPEDCENTAFGKGQMLVADEQGVEGQHDQGYCTRGGPGQVSHRVPQAQDADQSE